MRVRKVSKKRINLIGEFYRRWLFGEIAWR